ncbi:nucleotide-binding universal stress UspA family protein [Actinoplanes octamycinicus]|uniref:Nucleotide-binding universal stress UspA family protein n=1 Tax=Actinoplanes octamycinicus TaxID=135948 RepID=A0A7W7H2L7_9ACTN|nr:universal stress protein [Actinoplanes octamycinicus]MBB4742778.1 nucleotide-binding universal stress UspA family protein [Actinoplanes octamycinicus]GIE58367.1 universal stress protein [Actinoplanes octamycinicus]
MTMRTGAPVVVGVDGSASALYAVEAAAAEAVLRHRPLKIVHVYPWPSNGVALSPSLAATADATLRRSSAEILQDAAQHAAKAAPDLVGDLHTITGQPARALLQLSEEAALLVLGARGTGGFAGMTLGSVAAHTALHASCPVLLVRGVTGDGPVVVGADGSPSSVAACEFAADEADRRGAELVVLHAWTPAHATELNAGLPMSYEAWSGEEEHRRVLAEAVAGLVEQHPGLRIRRQVREGMARKLLTDWSHEAQLVVVGSRGHGGFAGLLLGSVSQHLIYRAGCPIAVVRPAQVLA